jgi:threonine aldolase
MPKVTAMSGRIVPLISDTESKPTAAMRQAIASAEVGDEQRGEDPTVNALQERVAELLGKEAALWFPGGTMCNFVAIKVHTKPADAIVVEAMAHIIRAESAGVAFSSGVLIEPIATERGVFTAHQLREAVSRLQTAPVPYGPPVRLVCVEQTHNFGGGAVWSAAELRDVSGAAHELGLAVHMDGARLLNASAATGVPPRTFAATADSVWIDFTKGLGAPIGAVLAGTAPFIAEARRCKHVFAGAMRQAGIAAAGCLYALDHHVERLVEDHARARRLAEGLAGIPGLMVRNPRPETNMVFFEVADAGYTSAEFLGEMLRAGVRMGQVRGQIRAVTHLDVTGEDIELAIRAAADIMKSKPRGQRSGAAPRPAGY